MASPTPMVMNLSKLQEDRGAWPAAVLGVTKPEAQLSDSNQEASTAQNNQPTDVAGPGLWLLPGRKLSRAGDARLHPSWGGLEGEAASLGMCRQNGRERAAELGPEGGPLAREGGPLAPALCGWGWLSGCADVFTGHRPGKGPVFTVFTG